VMLEASPSHAQTSAKARLANAARINPGRTGPKGIAGVTHEMAVKLGRDPDPEEVEDELRRNKVYGGQKSATKRVGIKRNVPKRSIHTEDNTNSSSGNDQEEFVEEEPDSIYCGRTPVNYGTQLQQPPSYTPENWASLHRELEELKAFRKATTAKATGGKRASTTGNKHTQFVQVSASGHGYMLKGNLGSQIEWT
jgi:hypothetical protein